MIESPHVQLCVYVLVCVCVRVRVRVLPLCIPDKLVRPTVSVREFVSGM